MSERQEPINTSAPASRRGSTSSEESVAEQTRAAGELPEVPQTAKTDIAKQREAVRTGVTLWLTILLGIVLVLGFYGAIQGGEAWTNTRDWLQTAVPAITGLLGSAIGFYFGSRRQ